MASNMVQNAGFGLAVAMVAFLLVIDGFDPIASAEAVILAANSAATPTQNTQAQNAGPGETYPKAFLDALLFPSSAPSSSFGF